MTILATSASEAEETMRMSLFNCRKLAELSGLDVQDGLREFRASGVPLDLNALRDRDWFPATRSVSLFSSSMKWNDDTKIRLAACGLGEKRSLCSYRDC
jgi:hypothetical protein